MSIDHLKWKPLTRGMRAAVDQYDHWSHEHLSAEDIKNKIAGTLYHYTDANGLKGVFDHQTIWFTSYDHLNDPGEITYGMDITTALLKEIDTNDPRIKMFCDMVIDLYTHDNMHSAFGIYLASFSRDGDDLGQWRAYGDNGRGYAIGFAPHLFHAIPGLKGSPVENYVVLPAAYGVAEGRALLMPCIAKALELVDGVVVGEAEAMRDVNVGMPFFDKMAKVLIASELILHSLTIKHEAYRHENEVRLALVGQVASLAPHRKTRTRGGELVPYLEIEMPVRAEGSISEIVVGPCASAHAEDGVRALAHARTHIRRSTIPYRAS
jgi:hypothetical protein